MVYENVQGGSGIFPIQHCFDGDFRPPTSTFEIHLDNLSFDGTFKSHPATIEYKYDTHTHTFTDLHIKKLFSYS
jgi:hypothetical protein